MLSVIGGVFAYKELASVVKESNMNIARSRHFVRLAGLSGAMAVALAAYGAHGFKDAEDSRDIRKMKKVFDSGNNMHLIHSLALLGCPLTKRPVLVGGLLTVGILVFSGSCYVNAFTGNQTVRMITPYGGMAFILAWLAMIL